MEIFSMVYRVADNKYLAVRKEPIEGGEEVGRVFNGDTFLVTGESSDGRWKKISFANKQEVGWVSADFLQVITKDKMKKT